ncbi:cyclic lactone autoinducer peptide [Paenibacillus tritici]|uniref:Cyclic lactone autoinducer peptide n=1 Tax=Paenibacillus tritici TaxID=1873425 RepID=A0ABX2DMV7_9BACL|nr:cyclic lactone autoinducer peptide [Paenibacillus tritici]NQX44954.1 cyclic lactone autoinducer peptide [Paenibacillus tritici]
MKKTIAKKASAVLAGSARFFVSIMKPAIHSPEAPKELRK